MAVGFNRIVSHEGRDLHVQIEDLGAALGVFEARIYEGGQVVFHKRMPHPPAKGAGVEERREQLKTAAEHLMVTLSEAIRRGKIGGAAGGD
jgi:hypothetical protein